MRLFLTLLQPDTQEGPSLSLGVSTIETVAYETSRDRFA